MDMRCVVEDCWGPPDKKRGKWWVWECRLHEDRNPSFSVTEDHAYCFSAGCNWSGGISWFLYDIMKVPGWKALEYTRHDLSRVIPKRKKRGLQLPPLPPSREWRDFFNDQVRFCAKTLWTLEGRFGREELAKRGISDDVAQRFYVGFNPSWMKVESWETHLAAGIVLPVYVDDKLWSVNVRTWASGPKYHRPKGGESAPFGLQQMRKMPILAICEGELDALTAASALGDAGDAIALRGTQNDIRAWTRFFNGYEQIVLCLDGDDAGKTASRLLLEVFPRWENRCPPASADDLGKMFEAGYNVRTFLMDGWTL